MCSTSTSATLAPLPLTMDRSICGARRFCGTGEGGDDEDGEETEEVKLTEVEAISTSPPT